MFRLLLPILLIIFFIWAVKYARQLPKAKKRRFWFKLGAITVIAVAIILLVSGRMHWLGAMAIAAVPLLGRAAGIALRAWPFLQLYKNHKSKQEQTNSSTPNRSHSMTVDEAAEILGVDKNADKAAIIAAHKHLMQRVHPDRGGNDHLASQVNAAKDLLLKTYS